MLKEVPETLSALEEGGGRYLWKVKYPLISSPKPLFLLVYKQKPWVLKQCIVPWSLEATSFRRSVSLKTPLEREDLRIISCRSTLLDSC